MNIGREPANQLSLTIIITTIYFKSKYIQIESALLETHLEGIHIPKSLTIN